MEFLLWVVCALLGWAAFIGLARLWALVVDRIPADQRSRSYGVAKNLPMIAFNVFVSLVFLAALGATVIHYVAFPKFASELRAATSWGPGTVVGLLVLLLYGWWCSPDAPPEAPPRGRTLKQFKHAAAGPKRARAVRETSSRRQLTSSSRGRTIRTFRENL